MCVAGLLPTCRGRGCCPSTSARLMLCWLVCLGVRDSCAAVLLHAGGTVQSPAHRPCLAAVCVHGVVLPKRLGSCTSAGLCRTYARAAPGVVESIGLFPAFSRAGLACAGPFAVFCWAVWG